MGLEDDADGDDQVAVIMKGETYRLAALKHSEHHDVEGKLYDKLCSRTSTKNLSRNEVRKLALTVAKEVNDDKFDATVNWLDDFMRRFCLSTRKSNSLGKQIAKLKIKGKQGLVAAKSKGASKANGAAKATTTASSEPQDSSLSSDKNNDTQKNTDSKAHQNETPVASRVCDKTTKNNSCELSVKETDKTDTANSNKQSSSEVVTDAKHCDESDSDDDIVNSSLVNDDEEAKINKPQSFKSNKSIKSIGPKIKGRRNADIIENGIHKPKKLDHQVIENKKRDSSVVSLDTDQEKSVVEDCASVTSALPDIDLNDIDIPLATNSEGSLPLMDASEVVPISESPSLLEDAGNDTVDLDTTDGDPGLTLAMAAIASSGCDEPKPAAGGGIRLRNLSDLLCTPEKEKIANDSGRDRGKDMGTLLLEAVDLPEKKVPGRSTLMTLFRTKGKEDSNSNKENSNSKATSKESSLEVYEKSKSVAKPEDEGSKKISAKKKNFNFSDYTEKSKEKGRDNYDKDSDSEKAESEETTTVSDSDDDDDEEEEEDDEGKASSEAEDDLIEAKCDDGDVESAKWEAENAVTYTKKEDKLFERQSKELLEKMQTCLPRCTGCNEQVNHKMPALVFTHPILGVLLCKRCRKFYGKGTWKKDKEGLDEYCRWCANGGDLMLCDFCTNGFCKPCLRRNFGRSAIRDVGRNKKWECYVCNMKPLTDLRLQHRAVLLNLRNCTEQALAKSRTERAKTNLDNKFAVLKAKRSEKNLATPSTEENNDKSSSSKVETSHEPETVNDPASAEATETSSEDSAPWLSTSLKDLKDMLDMCSSQVGRVQTKWLQDAKSASDSTRLQCSRRLLRLMRAMSDNFVAVENKFLANCGKDRDELVQVLLGLESEQRDVETKYKDVEDTAQKPVPQSADADMQEGDEDPGLGNVLDDDSLSTKEKHSEEKMEILEDVPPKTETSDKRSTKVKTPKKPETRHSDPSESEPEIPKRVLRNRVEISKKVEIVEQKEPERTVKRVSGRLLRSQQPTRVTTNDDDAGNESGVDPVKAKDEAQSSAKPFSRRTRRTKDDEEDETVSKDLPVTDETERPESADVPRDISNTEEMEDNESVSNEKDDLSKESEDDDNENTLVFDKDGISDKEVDKFDELLNNKKQSNVCKESVDKEDVIDTKTVDKLANSSIAKKKALVKSDKDGESTSNVEPEQESAEVKSDQEDSEADEQLKKTKNDNKKNSYEQLKKTKEENKKNSDEQLKKTKEENKKNTDEQLKKTKEENKRNSDVGASSESDTEKPGPRRSHRSCALEEKTYTEASVSKKREHKKRSQPSDDEKKEPEKSKKRTRSCTEEDKKNEGSSKKRSRRGKDEKTDEECDADSESDPDDQLKSRSPRKSKKKKRDMKRSEASASEEEEEQEQDEGTRLSPRVRKRKKSGEEERKRSSKKKGSKKDKYADMDSDEYEKKKKAYFKREMKKKENKDSDEDNSDGKSDDDAKEGGAADDNIDNTDDVLEKTLQLFSKDEVCDNENDQDDIPEEDEAVNNREIAAESEEDSDNSKASNKPTKESEADSVSKSKAPAVAEDESLSQKDAGEENSQANGDDKIKSSSETDNESENPPLNNDVAKAALLADSDSDPASLVSKDTNSSTKKKPKDKKKNTENEAAKQELLDSDSDEIMKDIMTAVTAKKSDKAKKPSKEQDESSKQSKSKNKSKAKESVGKDKKSGNDSDSSPSKSKNKSDKKAKTANEAALADLLKSDSDSEASQKSSKDKKSLLEKLTGKAKIVKKRKGKVGPKCSKPKSDGGQESDGELERLRGKRQLEEQKPVVEVTALHPVLLETLKKEESVSVEECEKYLKDIRAKNVSSSSSSSDDDDDRRKKKKVARSDEDSDAEFKSLMKFQLKKKFTSKTSTASGDNDEDDDSEEEELNNDKDEDKEKSDKDDKKDGESKEAKSKVNGKKEGSKKSKEGLLDISLNEEAENEEEEEEENGEGEKKTKKESKSVGVTLNDKIKKTLLMSSDEEGAGGSNSSEDAATKRDRELIEEEKKKKYEKMKAKQKEKELKEQEAEENDATENENNKEADDEAENDKVKKPVGKKGYMSLKFSSDEDEDAEKSDDKEADKKNINDDSEDSDDSEMESPRKSRMFIDSDSDFEIFEPSSRKRKAKDPSSESEDLSSDNKKKKRKRLKKTMSSSSEEDGAQDGDKNADEETPSKRKVRRIIKDADLTESTKNATQQEEDRRSRIKERQQLYNKIFEINVEADQGDVTKLVLDFDPETKEELVSVNSKLVPLLKPHQVKGIKFMWEATCESLERCEKEAGSGAILAHCMGLGKTLQVIVFLHTLLTCKALHKHMRRVLVLCPVNTVYNWVSEFKKWLKGKLLPFDVIELISAKDLWNRAYRLDEWHKESGVCIMGYDMFRTLSNEKNKKYKGKMKEIFQKTLVNPGPDFVICDEGHILKNEKSAISVAVNKMSTMRRVVLTGTPLQNNLKEYHCMIQFVKPNLLGTRKEFLNRFVNPINAGSCADATPRDVKRMKRRAHILHNLLEGCVQRFDYTVLKPFLPPKMEYVISVQMSDLQCELYSYYLANLAQGGPKRVGSGLFVDFNNLSRVWTHPMVLALQARRAMFDEDEEELDDFICDETTSESSDDDNPRKKKKKKNVKESEEEAVSRPDSPGDDLPDGLTQTGKVRPDWWKKIVAVSVDSNIGEDEWMNRIELSGKLVLLLNIMRECSSIGDKVLVFSQSILALDMIEEFLALIDQGLLEMPSYEDAMPLQFKHWKREKDYLRLDGSVSADIRKAQCKFFNEKDNDRCRLFLISTRAGGIGINLVAANRVIIFDSSWNPAHDTQSIFRVYRFGQTKPSYIYRFVAQGTMEEKIYSRQVNKISTSLRVVDEHQIKRYFNTTDLADLYEFNPADVESRDTPIVPEDRLLAELIIRHKNWIVGYHEHDSLLENQTNEELSEEERKAAWEDFENEKKGLVPQMGNRAVMNYGNSNMPFPASVPPFDINQVIQTIFTQNPNLTQTQLQENVIMATRQIQKIHLNHYQRIRTYVYNLKNPLLGPEVRAQLPYGDQVNLLPMLEAQLAVLEDNITKENLVINKMQPTVAPSSSQLMAAGVAYGAPALTGGSRTEQFIDRSKVIQANMIQRSSSMVTPASVGRMDGAGASTSAANAASSTSQMIRAQQLARKAQKMQKPKKPGSAEVVTLE
ncbi:transcriptional regulator ATRX isoform X2 [Hyalella azteca]|uniref:ATP-dependent helicase ATRX n=1 Tax=Hyalella azteca TaxID=294128 RepID=A0A979FRS0_HYAAZ|nr:transcriptional regulator ATRX isoform X2 [Hyalella azteca]